MKQYFDALINNSDGEMKYSRNIVIQAESLKEAKNHGNLIARNWLNKPAYKSSGWWYCPEAGRSIKVGQVLKTDAESFLQGWLMAA